MTYSRYLTIIVAVGIISLVGFALVVTRLNPIESTSIALFLFMVSLMFVLITLFTLAGFILRLWLIKSEVVFDQLNIALRQGVLLSFLTVACLLFKKIGVLTWWTAALALGIVLLMEFYFWSRS